MHDPRGGIGYKRLAAKDPEEQRLREAWHEARAALAEMGNPDTGVHRQAFQFVDEKLCAYLWKRCQDDIERDRRAHPKAQRNQPVPPRDPDAISTRVLP